MHELVVGNYEALAADAQGLTAIEIRRALVEYGETLVELPPEAFEMDNAYAYQKSYDANVWAIDLRL